MRAKYKSQTMREVMGSYVGPDVDERVKRIILSGQTDAVDICEAALRDLKEQERRLNEIGREHMSGPTRFIYRMVDQVAGFTSFDYRVVRQQRSLQSAKHALEFRLNKYKDLAEQQTEQLRDFRQLKRGARMLRSKYKAMETGLVKRELELKEKIDALHQHTAKNPDDFRQMGELDEAEAELEDYQVDLQQISMERGMASSQFANYHQLIESLRKNKVQLDAYMRALRQKYFSNTLTQTRLAGVSKQGIDPIGTMETLITSTKTAQGAECFAEQATQIQLEGVQAALSIPQEEFSYNSKSNRGVKDLERKSQWLDNELEDLVDRIIEEESRG